MGSRLSIGLLVVAILGFSLALVQGLRERVEDGRDLRISAEFEKVSIDEAIETLAESSGRAIDVIGVQEGRQVSLTPREADAVSPTGPDKFRITIGDLKRAAASMSQAEISSMEAFPPGPPDEFPVTVGDLELAAASAAQLDMSDMPAFPPGPADEFPVTIGDLERAASSTARPE